MGIEIPKGQGGIDRRSFLKWGTLAGVTTAFVSHEALKLARGIETDNGIFIPMYETHPNHAGVEYMPNGTNIYFTEITKVVGKDMFNVSGSELVRTVLGNDMKFLAENNIDLMVGDVHFSPIVSTIGAFIVPLEVMGGIYLFDRLRERSNPGEKEPTRREAILKGAKTLFTAWLGLQAITALVGGFTTYHPNMALRRITFRIDAIQQNLHPESFIGFFRSLVMADKLLEVARDYKDRVGQKPYVAFNVGGGHSQIEDFLQVGQDVCRGLITSYPEALLRDSIHNSGGVDNFCGARLLHIWDEDGTATERKIIDQDLRKRLNALA